ncbi:MAG: hypothetical protein KDB57_06145 [Solirubrobacterales bacterium]|jgi:hypothetical protein|nr:hypothetical protein [Solirubrobacterales bacterium]
MGKKKKSKSKSKKHNLTLSELQLKSVEQAIEILREKPGYKSLERKTVDFGDFEYPLDGVNSTGSRMVEINAHVGKMESVDLPKVTEDILRFAAIRSQPGREKARCEIFFVDEKARDSITGWIKEAASELGVGLEVIEGFPDKLHSKLVKAQKSRNKETGKKQALEDRLRKEIRREIEIQYRLSQEA